MPQQPLRWLFPISYSRIPIPFRDPQPFERTRRMKMRYCSLKKSWTEEDGAATVETAIALLAFLVMMLGAIELASVSWGKVSLNYAISQSARYAYVNSS